MQRTLDLCVLAEELGYEACWIGEHHFGDFGVMPNPAVWLAAAAQRTRKIRLGPAVSVLPFRHPLQVAEDYALVDQLSGGRLNLGVGSGTVPLEFDGFGIDAAEKRERFEESLRALREALRGHKVSQQGEYVRLEGVGSNVPAVHDGGPPIYVATNVVEGAHRVGRNGDNLLTLISTDAGGPEVIRDRLAAHRRGLAESGHGAEGADAAVAIMAHVAESDEQALENARPALIRFLKSHRGVSDEEAERIFDHAVDRQAVLFGSGATFATRLRWLAEAGVRHVVLWTDFGDLPRESVERSLRLAAQEPTND